MLRPWSFGSRPLAQACPHGLACASRWQPPLPGADAGRCCCCRWLLLLLAGAAAAAAADALPQAWQHGLPLAELRWVAGLAWLSELARLAGRADWGRLWPCRLRSPWRQGFGSRVEAKLALRVDVSKSQPRPTTRQCIPMAASAQVTLVGLFRFALRHPVL